MTLDSVQNQLNIIELVVLWTCLGAFVVTVITLLIWFIRADSKTKKRLAVPFIVALLAAGATAFTAALKGNPVKVQNQIQLYQQVDTLLRIKRASLEHDHAPEGYYVRSVIDPELNPLIEKIKAIQPPDPDGTRLIREAEALENWH